MGWFELFLLAVSLCFDTFAVSVSGSCSIKSAPAWRILLICSVFGIFQGAFTLIGWLGGMSFHHFISSLDHWIALALLLYIGVKMCMEGVSNLRKARRGESCAEVSVNLLSGKTLVLSSIATSIDALAVGITLAMVNLGNMKLYGGIAMITAVTVVASLAGIFSGKWLGRRLGEWAQVAGGCILATIGIKIFLEHTLFA